MLFAKTPISVFTPAMQKLLLGLDQAVSSDMLEAGGVIRDPLEPFSHLASEQAFSPEIFYTEGLGALLGFDHIEFTAAYLRDVDQSLGYDPFMIFADDFAGSHLSEVCIERSKGGVSGLLSRLRVSQTDHRHGLTLALLKWSNDHHLVLNDTDPGPLIQALHMDISSMFISPAETCLAGKSSAWILFGGVVNSAERRLDFEGYRRAIGALIDPLCLGQSLNKLIPHLMYDPIAYMCERGDETELIVSAIRPAFEILVERIECSENQRKTLFNQMMYNALSLYPDRQESLCLGSEYRLGNHPVLMEAEGLFSLSRILSGPAGAFVSDLQIDSRDRRRHEVAVDYGFSDVIAALNSHISRTPVVGFLGMRKAHEDVALIDYHLSKGNLPAEAIHYNLSKLAELTSSLSAEAVCGIVTGEVDFHLQRNRISSSNLMVARELIGSEPRIHGLLANVLTNWLDAGVPEALVTEAAKHINILSADLLRHHSLGSRSMAREGLLTQDLGL